MESQQPVTVISDKELALKKMGLTLKKEKVTNINLSDEETRKQLWDKWKTKHPESTITWKTKKSKRYKNLKMPCSNGHQRSINNNYSSN